MTQRIKQNKLSKGIALLYYVLAVILETLGSDYYALHLVKKALLKDPQKRALHLYASRLYLKRGQVDGSVVHWKKAVGPVHMGSFQYWLGQSNVAAVDSKNNIINRSSIQQTVFNDQGLLLLNKGFIKKALTLFFRDLKTGKENPVVFINIGLTFNKLNKHEEALGYYEKAQSMGLNNLELLNNKGYSLYYLNRFEEALACYELARNLDPQDPVILNNLATCYVKTNQKSQALNYFLAAMNNNSKNAILANNLAVCLGIVGKHGESIPYYDLALGLEKDTGVKNKILYNKALCLIQLQKYDEALVVCESIPCGDQEFEIWGLKAELLHELGRIKEAVESYRKALGLTG